MKRQPLKLKQLRLLLEHWLDLVLVDKRAETVEGLGQWWPKHIAAKLWCNAKLLATRFSNTIAFFMKGLGAVCSVVSNAHAIQVTHADCERAKHTCKTLEQ